VTPDDDDDSSHLDYFLGYAERANDEDLARLLKTKPKKLRVAAPSPERPEDEPLPDIGDDDPLDCIPPEVIVEKLECPVPTRNEFLESDLTPYDPMGALVREKLILAHARQLLKVGPFALNDLPQRRFNGEGVYALFYHGDLDIYAQLKSPGSTCLIYGGRADGRPDALYDRLTQHYRSLTQTGLGPHNFTWRHLVLPDTLLDIERALIDLFQPLWNKCLIGFGARHHHEDNRRNGSERASLWDTLHPGRTGAGRNPRDLESVRAELEREIPAYVNAWKMAMVKLYPG
jgi:hypothetical protein